MWRSLASNALTLFIVALVAVGGVIGWGQNQYLAQGPLAEAICLRVESGATMSDVSTDLSARGAVSNPRIFRIGASYTDKASALKAGSFLVPEGASMSQIVDIVTRGGQSTCGTEVIYRIGVSRLGIQVRELDPATNRYVEIVEFDPTAEGVAVPTEFTDVSERADTRYRVALAEGVTSWQVIEGVKAVDVMAGEILAVPPEGRLAPDSYEVRRGDDRGDLLALMQARQTERLETAWQQRADDLPYETPDQALTAASLIEKETGPKAEERPVVGSVIVNRLRSGIRLQMDPTIIYGITRGQYVLERGITNADKRGETERRLHGSIQFNTYEIDGLPPTPIANPGLLSIQAALAPAETGFQFFVADGTGGHAFAVTLDEHNANVAKWREIEASRTNN